MDYSRDLLEGSNVFTETSNYINLKLQSPMPSPFKGTKEDASTDTSNNLSPTRPGRAGSPSDDKLENSVLSLGQELRDEELRSVLTRFDVFKLLLSKVGGKDRLAKVSQYVLNLIKLYLINTRRYLVNEKFTDLSLDPRQHWQTPFKYAKLLVFLNSTILEKKITELTKNISAFRYALRFGGTPNRLRSFILKFNTFIKNPTPAFFQKLYLNEDSLGDFIDLWYGIFDELELLFKVNVLTNPTFKSFVSRQGALAWYADIILGLKKNWWKLQANRERQVQINIQHQVKQRASLLSKRLVEGIGSTPLREQLMREFNNKSPMGNGLLMLELKELKYEEKIVLLDLVRLSFDFVCDTIDVFNLKLPAAVYLLSGAFSGSCGLSKVWLMCKKELSEDK
ncbi:CYFA0S01e15412g1_1 [Cyberlindnera fabianii]|uniref:CYFA0S01e15412g1_1 n=1 Tax=Cyberlindnera fabianii TaxID=36022 RepID=A0A061AJD8_CYBFA|nr:CYFA0S01e15412g1_1 [Cyberlindnera fabianii]